MRRIRIALRSGLVSHYKRAVWEARSTRLTCAASNYPRDTSPMPCPASISHSAYPAISHLADRASSNSDTRRSGGYTVRGNVYAYLQRARRPRTCE